MDAGKNGSGCGIGEKGEVASTGSATENNSTGSATENNSTGSATENASTGSATENNSIGSATRPPLTPPNGGEQETPPPSGTPLLERGDLGDIQRKLVVWESRLARACFPCDKEEIQFNILKLRAELETFK